MSDDLLKDLAKLRDEVGKLRTAAADTALAAEPSSVSWRVALDRLREGNSAYARGEVSHAGVSADRVARTKSQAPFAAIIGCADSRVTPETAFNQAPGQLFVCRVAGNVVNADILASLEYAIGFLGTKLILVLGHTNCGAVDAGISVLSQGAELPGHIQDLAVAIAPAVARARRHDHDHDLLKSSVRENVKLQMERLVSRSVVISDGVKSGEVGVAGGVYDLATGKIELFEP